MNEQAAVDSKGWNKAQEVMNLAEKSGWKMLLTPYRTYVTLEMTRGVESIEISWRDKGTLMSTRHYVSATRNTRSFSFAEALRIIAAVPAPVAEVKVEAPSLPTVSVPGYSWRWFNPQGGEPISDSIIQLMRDGETLTPSALLWRNADGTWRAERGPAWGMSGIIFGSYAGSYSMEVCAGAVAGEADERGMIMAQLELLDQAREEDESLAYSEELMMLEESERIRREVPAKVGKLCKVKRSSAGHRAKWRKGR